MATTTLTFDDIILAEGQEARIANGYAGFTWTQAGVYNPNGTLGGYTAASGENLAFIAEADNNVVPGYDDAVAGTPFTLTRDNPFDLLSADFSAAFRDGIVVTVNAYADEAGTQFIGTVSFSIDRGAPQAFDFDETLFTGIRRLEFNGNDLDNNTRDYFGIDNLALRDTVTVLNFDDIVLSGHGETALVDGYAGFDWSGVGVYHPDGTIPGYQASSGQNIGFIAEADGQSLAGYEDHAGGTAAVLIAQDAFTFVGGSFSAAFRDDLDVTITAYADAEGTIVIGTAAIQLDRGLQAITFTDGVNVNGTFDGALRLEFASNDNNGATRDYFGFDDLTFIL